MVKKIIFIVMILLVMPVTLALIKEPKPPAITSREELCVTVATGSGDSNFIKFYINGAQYRKIKLRDGREVDKIDAKLGGTFTGCIKLLSGENNVKIEYTYDKPEEFTIIFDQTAPDLKGLDVFPNYINKLKKKIPISLDEPSKIFVTVNGNKEKIELSEGNHEINIPLKGEFNEGENTIKIEVEDQVGNKKTILEEKTITADTKKPKITISSVDGKSYSRNMKVDFAVTKIIGETEPGISLKVINLFDNTTYYFNESNKFVKINGEEITSKSERAVELNEDGKFEVYIDLLPVKNTIVFLAEDLAGNINTIPTDKNNIETSLFLNFEGGENWNIYADPISAKIKGTSIFKNEVNAKIEIRFSPKNIAPEEIKDIKLSIPPPDINKGHNRLITPRGSPSKPYYDRKKKAYIVYQDLTISPGPWRTLEDIPDTLSALLRGDIHFYVGDPAKTRPLTEHIPIDLLFYVDVEHTKLLNPVQMLFSQEHIETWLKDIQDWIKPLQKYTLIDVGICAALKLYNNVVRRWIGGEPSPTEKKIEYTFCDRVICYDTVPYSETAIEDLTEEQKTELLDKYKAEYGEDNVGSLTSEDEISVYRFETVEGTNIRDQIPITKFKGTVPTGQYLPGYPYYHETACLPNVLLKKPITIPGIKTAPVWVHDDLVESTKCGCLSGMWIHIRNLYATLSAMQGCLEQARVGEKDLGECDVKIAQATCALTFWSVERYLKDKGIFDDIYERSYDVRGPGTLFIDLDKIDDVKDAAKEVNKGELKKKTFSTLESIFYGKVKKQIYEQACIPLIAQDWQHIETTAIKTAMEGFPSFGKPIVKSWIEEKGDRHGKYLVIRYEIIPAVVAGSHDVDWRIDFVCDPNEKNYELCKGESPTNLESQLRNRKTTISPGVKLKPMYAEERDPEAWFNKIEMYLTYYVTVFERTITRTLEADIKQEGDLGDICNREDEDGLIYDYGVCKKYLDIS